mmetsp:Transcript_16814/g.53246  ORF Transcript_16814/g.53246 Transcript_16814/m.53246 type:complete len:163 (-) Transcript_16814:621-1109(-)
MNCPSGQVSSCSAYCTGSLVTPGAVITVAHCFYDERGNQDQLLYPLSRLRLAINDNRWRDTLSSNSNPPYRVKEIIRGPWEGYIGDVAIAILGTCTNLGISLPLIAGPNSPILQTRPMSGVVIVGPGRCPRPCSWPCPPHLSPAMIMRARGWRTLAGISGRS